MLRFQRKMSAAQLQSREEFPFGLQDSAWKLCSLVVGQANRDYRFERMYANVLAEPGQRPRVVSRTYSYRRIVEGAAVLGKIGEIAVRYDRAGQVVNLEAPLVSLYPVRKVQGSGDTEGRVLNLVGGTQVVRDGELDVSVSGAQVKSVAPALVLSDASGRRSLVPLLLIMVDYEWGEGKVARKEHRLSLAEE